MAVSVVVVPEAEQDVTDAYHWYEARRVGLGEEFLSCLDACIETIRRSPHMHPTVFRRFRRTLLRRFPYAVFYECESDVATIFGVLHTSRHPARWMRRVTGDE
ncbi:type II toxin-antitoxin system RelE/ParE family toxin [candidate division WOR-3 bacterium]|nr:type II toxin-antitoxin system RelE/ParE family toxin [candidate division WOR-3 bacterium]